MSRRQGPPTSIGKLEHNGWCTPVCIDLERTASGLACKACGRLFDPPSPPSGQPGARVPVVNDEQQRAA